MKNSAEEETDNMFVKPTKSERQQMTRVHGDINVTCYGGRAYGAVKEAVKQPGYSMWEGYCYLSILYEYLEYIIGNMIQDYNVLGIE